MVAQRQNTGRTLQSRRVDHFIALTPFALNDQNPLNLKPVSTPCPNIVLDFPLSGQF
jgi:hypothetical protein